MKLDIFEGFKRFNQIVIFIILVMGIILSFSTNGYISKSIHPLGGNSCISSVKHSVFKPHGTIDLIFCFNDKKNDSEMWDVASKYSFSQSVKLETERQLKNDWIKNIVKNVFITIIFAISYFILCKFIKYIARGFLKTE